MSDEDDDYMSDKFLAAEVRPSLIHSAARKRLVEVTEKQSQQIKRQRQESLARQGVVDNERLQQSLQQPIAAQNKGFQMLAKMGYKPGQALGREKDGAEKGEKRLTEPIGINIKTDRGGLGREAALRDLAEKRRKLRQQHLRHQMGTGEQLTTEEFRKRATQKAEERYTVGALKRCQLSCETLDAEAGVKVPEMCWFWPERKVELDTENADEEEGKLAATNSDVEAEAEEEEDVYTAAEKLEMLTSYLRISYKFCFFCGVHYTDEADLADNCPGETRDEH